MPDLVANNLLGLAEHAALTPMVAYRIDRDGHPYVPVGDGGIVQGVHLGDSVFATDGDHVAPGVSLVHSDPAARFALTAYSCIGNEVIVRSGLATGAVGRVVGKRGESGRVIVALPDEAMAALLPGDQLSVRAVGQGFAPVGLPAGVAVMNVDPDLFALLPFGAAVGAADTGAIAVSIAGALPSRVCGNGIGRPAQMWDVDLAVVTDSPDLKGRDMRLGELWAIENLDVRNNMGYRRDWVTVGVICHGGSPMPGHGPGLVPLATGPQSAFRFELQDAGAEPALTESVLAALPNRALAARAK
ncbi:hypothetical protein B7R54_17790 [Subtercola boreus]|uniref:DUF4438 domain-containing protein n=1 Tax=Subtercola boreus TaxID=120213 RepID=A0A3E0VMA2_9MICO|nr:DUF4438 domain-containing protein [Subtercola boreus]RFA10851.1 hypothetical protein B7R54_17790 [Subtercola boreus]TQL55566.1 uncharacterized protein DUF4438 [Subtercola boreus]